ncbi:SDR family NAD(P)-dependent oxidoreductase [Neptuniibacter sp. QD48_55]|uniref:SDR family NAD(P)-dependent oxidoreductase n=1 Tax=Neptuniibacter sp. QD48_55 TaxID=3398212 RepID=UPI0039F6073D
MNRLAFITGGSRGIGETIVKQLANEGYKVAFTYQTQGEAAKKIASNLNKLGCHTLAVKMDQSCRDSISSALKAARIHFKLPITILVNNAAQAQEKPFEEINDKDWEDMLNVNLQGPYRCIQECLNDMKSEQYGRIVNITSIGGQWGGRNQVHYAASKAGLINLSHSISNLYSSDGILSNSVAVGLAATDMSQAELSRSDGQSKVAGIPLGRIATCSEISQVVSFLCSEKSSYITGQTINANGGMLNS